MAVSKTQYCPSRIGQVVTFLFGYGQIVLDFAYGMQAEDKRPFPESECCDWSPSVAESLPLKKLLRGSLSVMPLRVTTWPRSSLSCPST